MATTSNNAHAPAQDYDDEDEEEIYDEDFDEEGESKEDDDDEPSLSTSAGPEAVLRRLTEEEVREPAAEPGIWKTRDKPSRLAARRDATPRLPVTKFVRSARAPGGKANTTINLYRAYEHSSLCRRTLRPYGCAEAKWYHEHQRTGIETAEFDTQVN